MTITTRLSLFVLVALGAVLVGFSLTIYALANWQLQTQLDRHLESAMHVLVASIEVHPQDVEWEPLEREVTLGRDPDLSQVRWTMRDERGTLIDHSGNLSEVEACQFPYVAGDWRLIARRLNAGRFEALPVDVDKLVVDKAAQATLPEDRTAVKQSFLLVVGVAEEPVRAQLLQLAMALASISLVIWLVAAVTGHLFCKQALLPVTRMAAKARSIQQEPQSHQLLDVSASSDELTDLGHSFNALLTSLRESIEQQRRFAGDASHQLRTPLTALLAAVDVSARHARSVAEYQRVLGVVQRRGRDLQQIVETLLMLTRGELPDEQLHFETLELRAWCEVWQARWQDHVRVNDLHLECCSHQVIVRTHPNLLGQILDNLVDNALKYSDAGSPIVIHVSGNTEDAIFSVSDQGLGIAADELARVFQPFFRSSQARYRGEPGIGLGLCIAQRLATHLGAQLDVKSNLGSGSTFSLRLPCSGRGLPAESPQLVQAE